MNLLPDELSRKIFHMARVWTKQLLDAKQPKLIIAEVFKAFDELEVLFPKKVKFERGDSFKSFRIPEGLEILGNKRNQSSILNKQLITEYIN